MSEAAAGVKWMEAVPSPASEDVDVGGGWRVVGGSIVRVVEVLSQLGGPVGLARTAGLPGVVEKVQGLLQSESKAWGVSAKVWNQHGSDENLWSVSGVSKEAEDAGVVDRLRVHVVAGVGTADVVDW